MNKEYHIEVYDGDNNEKYVLLDDLEVVLNEGQKRQEIIDAVIDDMKHFHLIYDEDGKLISSDKCIFAEIRYFIDKLEGTIPVTMTPFEHSIWEKENKKNEDTN